MPGQILSVLGMIFAIAAILGLAYWFTRYVAGRAFAPGAGAAQTSEFSVLAQLMLGKGQRLLVVRIGERCLLLGVCAESISLLAELTEEEAAAWLTGAQNHAQNIDFAAALRNIITQKK